METKLILKPLPRVQWNLSSVDTLGTAESVLIKGGILISGVILYASLCSWGSGPMKRHLYREGPL